MLRITSVQMNPTVGALRKNAQIIIENYLRGRESGADIIATSEMSLSGYPVEDLVLQKGFLANCLMVAEEVASFTTIGTALLFGLPVQEEDGNIYNAFALAYDGKIQQWFYKHELPNYGVFDEVRLFAPGIPSVFEWKGTVIGVAICEDVWKSTVFEQLKELGAELVISPNGSPWDMYKYDLRLATVRERVKETGLPILYINQWGGQDELVFDGHSFALNPENKLYQAHGWGDETTVITFEKGRFTGYQTLYRTSIPLNWHVPETNSAALYLALLTGLRDYLTKNGFTKAVLGLSGGVDSALVATLAADAIGAENVQTVMLPSNISSEHSVQDATDLATRQGLPISCINIQEGVDAKVKALSPLIKAQGVTLENIQARERGALLMAVSNATGALLLSTGNKSEMSVGYATLYGDMNGGFNPLKDVYKLDVFRLCHWRNTDTAAEILGKKADVIPENILTKPPSAELSEDQQDTDSLPPYEVLDSLLKLMIEGQLSATEIIRMGMFDEAEVNRIWKLLLLAEYKRRQAAPGVRVTPISFGARDRRFPITNQWRNDIEHS